METGGLDPTDDIGIGDGIDGGGTGGQTGQEEEDDTTGDAGSDDGDGGDSTGGVPDEASQAEQEEQEEEQAAEAPIEAPATVIDTSGVNPNQDVYAPVSGGANPALVGSAKPAEEGGDDGSGTESGEGQ